MEQISKSWPQFKIKLENELVNRGHELQQQRNELVNCGNDLQQVNDLINHGHNLNTICEQISQL